MEAKRGALETPTVRLSDTPTPTQGPLALGQVVGRFIVHECLGRGGMSVVYAAWDPVLERRVALKLLHGQLARSPEATSLILEEARALARLKSPHVVTVHDVGSVAEGLYLAMDLVDGVRLTRWLDERRRTHDQILAIFVMVGRGLAAAHRGGVIHRDLKPDNILVDESGRARVVDFGLARLANAGERMLRNEPGDAGAMGTPVTTPRMGTPAFMAPEQFAGVDADERSDQFSFCVALWLALCGQFPFPGQAALGLPAAPGVPALFALTPTAPTHARVPPWLEAVLRRGLAEDPAGRHPSMDALADALQANPAARRRAIARIGGLATGAAIAAAIVTYWTAPSAARPQCIADDAAWNGIWDPARRGRLAARFGDAAEISYGAELWTRVEQRVNAHRDRWHATQVDICRATHDRGDQSAALLDHRMSCMTRALSETSATLDVLGTLDAHELGRAPDMVAMLPDVSRCRHSMPGDEPAGARDNPFLAAVGRRRIAEVRATALAGRFTAALAMAESIRDDATRIGDRWLATEAELEVASARADLGEHGKAAELARTAALAATRLGDDELTIQAYLELFELADERDDSSDRAALVWADLANALLERGPPRPRLTARLAAGRCALLLKLQQGASGVEQCKRALEILRAAHPDDAVALAKSWNNLGVAYLEIGELAQAEAALREALGKHVAARGAGHPDSLTSRNNLGYVLTERGKYDESLRELETTRTGLVAAVGADHKYVADALHNLGNVLVELQRTDEAERHFSEALRIRRKVYGDRHAKTAEILYSLARVAEMRDDQPEADRLHREVLALRIALFGETDPRVAAGYHAVGLVAYRRGDDRTSEEYCRRALAALEGSNQADSPHAKIVHVTLGMLQLRTRRPAQGIASLERALKIYDRAGVDPANAARLQAQIGIARWEHRLDRPRGLEMVRASVARLERAGDKAGVAEARAWVAARDGRTR